MAKRDDLFIFVYIGCRCFKAVQRELVSAIAAFFVFWIDAEGRKDVFVFDQSYPQHVPDEVDAHRQLIAPVDPCRSIRVFQREIMIELHAFGSPFLSIFPASLR